MCACSSAGLRLAPQRPDQWIAVQWDPAIERLFQTAIRVTVANQRACSRTSRPRSRCRFQYRFDQHEEDRASTRPCTLWWRWRAPASRAASCARWRSCRSTKPRARARVAQATLSPAMADAAELAGKVALVTGGARNRARDCLRARSGAVPRDGDARTSRDTRTQLQHDPGAGGGRRCISPMSRDPVAVSAMVEATIGEFAASTSSSITPRSAPRTPFGEISLEDGSAYSPPCSTARSSARRRAFRILRARYRRGR